MTETVILIGWRKVVENMPDNTMWKVKLKQPLNNKRDQWQVVLERC